MLVTNRTYSVGKPCEAVRGIKIGLEANFLVATISPMNLRVLVRRSASLCNFLLQRMVFLFG